MLIYILFRLIVKKVKNGIVSRKYVYKTIWAESYFVFGPSSFIYVFSLIRRGRGDLILHLILCSILHLTLYFIASANCTVFAIGLSTATGVVTRSRPATWQNNTHTYIDISNKLKKKTVICKRLQSN